MNRLRDLRGDHDLLQKDVAKIIGISQRGYSHYETEENNIPNEILKKLAIFYNTSTDYILGITNEKKPYPRNNKTVVYS